MAWPSCYDHVFRALGDSLRWHDERQRGSALCPNHDDSKPSLSIGIGTSGKLLLRCCAPRGCTTAHILGALGLMFDDLHEDNKQSGGKRVSTLQVRAVHQYRKEDGRLSFEVVRGEDKGTRVIYQRQPNPRYDPKQRRSKEANPEFLNHLDGVQPCLYLLPELLAALREKPNRWVILPEGEADADQLRRDGFTTTTNPMGALKWRDEYSAALNGRNVVVIPDEDPIDPKLEYSPGCRHAEEVCASLVRAGANKVKVVRLPHPPRKGDYRDWRERVMGEVIAENAERGVAPADAERGATKEIVSRFAALIQSAPNWPCPIVPIDFPPEPEPPALVPTAREQALTASAAKASAPRQQTLPTADPVPESEIAIKTAMQARAVTDSGVAAIMHPAFVAVADSIRAFWADLGRDEISVGEWWGQVSKAVLMIEREMAEPKADGPAVVERAVHLAAMTLLCPLAARK